MSDTDTQVLACCRALIRTMREQGLRAGDKLPSQDELRGRLGFSHNSLTPAMQLLVEAGMLRRQRKQGTILLDPAARVEELWRVGVALAPVQPGRGSAFSALLSRCLQEELLRANCRLRLYLRSAAHQSPDPAHDLTYFTALREDAAAGRLDGLITPAPLGPAAFAEARRNHIALCHLGTLPTAPLRVTFDIAGLLREAVSRARAARRRRLAILCSCGAEAMAQLRQSLQHAGLTDTGDFWRDLATEEDTRRIVQELLAPPAARRAQAVIVLNDMIALNLSVRFAQHGWRVPLAVMSNAELPLYYALPVERYAFSVQEMARLSVALTRECMENAAAAPAPVLLPHQYQPEAAC